MSALVRLVRRDIRVLNRSLLVIQLVLPLFLIFVAGLPYSALIPPFTVAGQALNYERYLAIGLIAQTTMSGSLIGGTLLFTDRRHGMYDQILAGPYSRSEYATGKVISSVIIGLGGAALVALFGLPFTYGISPGIGGVVVAIASLIAGAFLFGGLSMLLANAFKSLEAFEGTFNFLLILLTFVSSALYPLAAAPPPLRDLMLLNPLTYEVDLLRLGLLGISSPYSILEAVVLVAEGLLVFAVAIMSFRRIRAVGE